LRRFDAPHGWKSADSPFRLTGSVAEALADVARTIVRI
jgi:hypothetical protein